MTFVCKMTASQQLAYDATVCTLRHHFKDRRARWRDWELHDVSPAMPRESNPDNPVIAVKNFSLIGTVGVPSLNEDFYVTLCCAMREMRDGSRYIFSVNSTFPLVSLDSRDGALRHLCYYLGQRRPPERNKSDLQQFLSRKFSLPPRALSARD
jgi:hypothetical protein